MEFSRQEQWSRLPFSFPGYLPDPGIEPRSSALHTDSLPSEPPGNGFPSGVSGEEPTCQCRRHKRFGFNSQVGKIPWRRAWQPTPIFLPGEPMDLRDAGLIPRLGRSPGGGHGNPPQYSCLENPCRQRSLAGYSPQGDKESDTTEATQHASTSYIVRVDRETLGGSVLLRTKSRARNQQTWVFTSGSNLYQLLLITPAFSLLNLNTFLVQKLYAFCLVHGQRSCV